MANEGTKVELYGDNSDGDPRRFECASGVAIVKGQLLKLVDGREASWVIARAEPFAGVAAMAKAADDNSKTVSCWENGILEFTASLAIVAGQKVVTQEDSAAGNYVTWASDADVSSSYTVVIGTALKNAANAARVQVRVDN